jgi:hypothetical protein
MQRTTYLNNGYLVEVKNLAEKLELVFMDKNGKFYPIDEVGTAELARGLEKISKEIAARLRLQKEQR